MYLTQPLHRNAQRLPDAPATIDGDRISTWSEVRDRVARFAGALQASGLRLGDRVAMMARNGDAFFDYVLGTLWAGGVINPVNLRLSPTEIGYSLENCQTAILFVDAEFAPLVTEIRRAAPGLRHVISTGNPVDGSVVPMLSWLAAGAAVDDAVRRGDDLAAILYTGGTTGFPKGVMLSHTNLASSALGVISVPHCRPGARYLHTPPLFHVGALSGLFSALMAESTHVFVPGFEPVAVLEAISRHRVTEVPLVPTMMRMLIDHPRFTEYDVRHVERIRYGASPIDDALLDRVIAAFPLATFSQAYGMTEVSSTATILPPEDHSAAARAEGRGRSAGRATTVNELRIVDPEGCELPRGQIGEIVARGPNVMLGYWNLPDQTAEAVRDGWMHTGDLGRMDANGYITVVDRLKDMIITGGENVYSAEVENALATHPAVAQAAVIALPDPQWGERVHAVVVMRAGETVDVAALQAHCRAQIAGFKVPRSIAFVDAMPLSAAGKVLKNVLREQAHAR